MFPLKSLVCLYCTPVNTRVCVCILYMVWALKQYRFTYICEYMCVWAHILCVCLCSEYCIHTFIHHIFLIQVMGNMNISSTPAFSLYMFSEDQQWSWPGAKLGLLCLLGAALDFHPCFRKLGSSPVWCLKHRDCRKFTPFSFYVF